MRSGGTDGGSSSGEEDGDADWRAAIASLSAGNLPYSASAASEVVGAKVEKKPKHGSNKLYLVKAQKMLDDILEKNLSFVACPTFPTDGDHQQNDEGVQLFRQAPRGIVFDHIDEQIGPRKRPRLLSKEEDINEKSKKFRLRVRSVAVDGYDVIASAETAVKKSLSRFEAKSLEAKAKANQEEQRVAKLRKMRGERWLPSVARAMQRGMNASKKAKVVGVVL